MPSIITCFYCGFSRKVVASSRPQIEQGIYLKGNVNDWLSKDECIK